MLFNIAEDPAESMCLSSKHPEVMETMRQSLIHRLASETLTLPALNANGNDLLDFSFEPYERVRIKQFGSGINDFGQVPVVTI